MSSLYCGVCRQTVVRASGDVCASCRYKGHISIKETRVDPGELMGELEPLKMLEEGLRQCRVMQARLGKVMDGAEAFRPDVVKEQKNLALCLRMLAQEWRMTKEFAKNAVDTMDQEEREALLVEWFDQLPLEKARGLIQKLTRSLNERAA